MMRSPASRKIPWSEHEFDAQLRSEGYTHGCAGPEEITQCPSRPTQLVEANDGLRLGAGSIQAESRGIGKIIDGRGQRGNIRDVVRSGIVAVKRLKNSTKGTSE